MRVNSRIRRAVNTKLNDLLRGYKERIPMSGIESIMNAQGLQILDEDNLPLKGCILCGENSNTTFQFSSSNGIVTNSLLLLSWYKMQSGRYEVLAYIT